MLETGGGREKEKSCSERGGVCFSGGTEWKCPKLKIQIKIVVKPIACLKITGIERTLLTQVLGQDSQASVPVHSGQAPACGEDVINVCFSTKVILDDGADGGIAALFPQIKAEQTDSL